MNTPAPAATIRHCVPRTTLRALALVACGLFLSGCGLFQQLHLAPPPPVSKTTPPDEGYEIARQLYQEQKWEEAEEAFESVWQNHPDSEYASDARFHAAECRYSRGKYRGAFELYKSYVDAYPLSPYAVRVQERLYEMGTFTIEEGKNGMLGVFTYSDDGVAYLDFLVSAFPHGNLADDALMYSARYEMEAESWFRAIAHLYDLIEFYPQSEWALAARLELARAHRNSNRGTNYDGDALRKSAAQYRAYIDLVTADVARAREYTEQLTIARAELADLEEQLADKMLRTAEYYLRTGKSEAAQTEYQNLVTAFPSTAAADAARERLGREDATPTGETQ